METLNLQFEHLAVVIFFVTYVIPFLAFASKPFLPRRLRLSLNQAWRWFLNSQVSWWLVLLIPSTVTMVIGSAQGMNNADPFSDRLSSVGYMAILGIGFITLCLFAVVIWLSANDRANTEDALGTEKAKRTPKDLTEKQLESTTEDSGEDSPLSELISDYEKHGFKFGHSNSHDPYENRNQI